VGFVVDSVAPEQVFSEYFGFRCQFLFHYPITRRYIVSVLTALLNGKDKVAICHEDVWGSGGIAPPFLTSLLDVGEWSASRPDRFTHWMGGWMLWRKEKS
jgi:hypothetical protein